MTIKSVIRRISFVIEQAIRILSMQLILAPAAYVLPKKISFVIADTLALFLLVLPEPALDRYQEMRSAFGKSRINSFFLAWRWLALPFRDFVVLRRLMYKREKPLAWKIIEKNADGFAGLRESGESFIIATAHFSKEASLSIFSPTVTYGNIVVVGIAPLKRFRSLYNLRIRIQYGTLLKGSSACWGRDLEFVFVGSDLRTARELSRQLREQGNVIIIAVDAVWRETITGSFKRPFAGSKSRWFSTGAAQLSRLTGCSIISCIPIQESDENTVLEWGNPIRNVGRKEANDVDVMNELLNTIEIAIGERPTQYMFDIGSDRRWNYSSRKWDTLIE